MIDVDKMRRTLALEVAASSWFDNMSVKAQREYIRTHPGTKMYIKSAPAKRAKPRSTAPAARPASSVIKRLQKAKPAPPAPKPARLPVPRLNTPARAAPPAKDLDDGPVDLKKWGGWSGSRKLRWHSDLLPREQIEYLDAHPSRRADGGPTADSVSDLARKHLDRSYNHADKAEEDGFGIHRRMAKMHRRVSDAYDQAAQNLRSTRAVRKDRAERSLKRAALRAQLVDNMWQYNDGPLHDPYRNDASYVRKHT